MPEIENAILGMHINESKEVEYTVPANSKAKILRKKNVKYEIKLLTISAKKFADLDDAFALSLDPTTPTLEDLKVKIREDIQKELDRKQF